MSHNLFTQKWLQMRKTKVPVPLLDFFIHSANLLNLSEVPDKKSSTEQALSVQDYTWEFICLVALPLWLV